jgi:hypothetical protein
VNASLRPTNPCPFGWNDQCVTLGLLDPMEYDQFSGHAPGNRRRSEFLLPGIVISFCPLTRRGCERFLFNNYSPPAGFFWNEKFHLHWVSYKLTPDLRCRRLEICGRLLPILEVRKLNSFQMLVTGIKSWLVLESQHSTK